LKEVLTRISKSNISMMFNDRWEHELEIDQNGNIFFDFNPILFRHLLDQLQLFHSKDFIDFSLHYLNQNATYIQIFDRENLTISEWQANCIYLKQTEKICP